MKNILKVILVLGMAAILSGCFSMMAYKSNEKQVYGKYAYRSGDQQVIKAYTDGKYVQMGVDVTAADVIFDSWGTFSKQILGALGDAATGYGIYYVADQIGSGGDDSGDDNSSTGDTGSRDTASINIDGNENNVTITTGDDRSGDGRTDSSVN